MRLSHELKAYGIQPKKKFGQNFLQDPALLKRIVDLGAVGKDDVVLEIGTGPGTLTKSIAQEAKSVVTIEIDESLAPFLQTQFALLDNIHLIFGDALKLDLDALVYEKTGAKNYTIIANLPYYITTPLIMHILEHTNHVRRLVLMVQKEVATRLAAPAGQRDGGAVSVAVQYRASIREAFTVPKGAFYPPPKVDSALIVLDPYLTKPLSAKSDERFRQVVRAAFSLRRKTLRNALKQGFSPDEIEKALALAHIDPSARAENLTVEDFIALADAFEEVLTHGA